MPTQGEFEYFRRIGEAGMVHATGKPWSDANCGLFLMELGAMMGLIPGGGGRLLDLGCGTGWTSVLFAKRGYDVVGQELVTEAVEAARRLKEENGLDNLDFVQCDFENLPFENEFDVAVFFDCLHHAMDERKVLEGVYRALKPGGVCIASEPGIGHAWRGRHAVVQYGVTERDMEPGKIIRAAKRAGFRKASVHPHASHLHIALYQNGRKGRIGRILDIPGVRSLAAIAAIVIGRSISGITVLQK